MKTNIITLAIVASLTLSACGGSSGGSPASDPVTPTNSAPTNVTITNITVDENSVGAAIGTLSATDANSGDTFTFTTDSDMFVVTGNELSLKADTMANFENAESLAANITVTDNGGLSYSKELTITVNDLLDTYKFESKIIAGESSVGYTGQIARHALIAELAHYIGSGLQADIDANAFIDKQAVLDKLNSYFRTTSNQYENNFSLNFLSDTKQPFITDISSSAKSLDGKIAGRDASRMRKDWTDGTSFVGAGANMTPETLVDAYFNQLADNAVDANIRLDEATNSPITKVYVNTDGTDLKQLLQKFLLMSVTYSQGTDDYLDEGLAIDNIDPRGTGKADTALEHGFDEGFGYFGAARNYLEYTDKEIAGKVKADDATTGRADWNGKHDTDGDALFDLTSEVNLGSSVNAAKRDIGSSTNANPTDFTKDAMEAFLAARKIINDNVGTVFTAEQTTALETQRDNVVNAWEKAIAATVIHYINDLRADLAKSGDEYNYENVAKHWSEMKGFALGLQFNPYSPITDAQFAEIHVHFGQKPVLLPFGSADKTAVTTYIADLAKARDILQKALGLDADNVANW
ncbi:DUF4856 domain-containing protein [Colwellia hornerae]|uniref:Cadherin repeat domain-containing protein n=1 Tax=Colwellia hornerae TaxID=89402 RepID=A0A5C6Q800_9GAMM|nr:DUF4856 domain-containing protein [Colwellia hornerae]TWX50225.1 cadherin repeat domain-containing protein [Colwellia hornerae]TWX56122.1 cadherin repeat domain-containing protein [Colwellia hornerae]TWX65144.1 cadherin repeat domain-containing protein [Colwellia hornerae]